MSYKMPGLFACLILASLWPGPMISGRISNILGSAYIPALYGICAAATIGVVILWVRNHPTLRSSTLIIIAFALSVVVIWMTVCANEMIHLLEYGILGYLFAAVPAIGIIWGFVISSFVGILDEIIQWLLPNRFFEVRDVAMNLISAGVGIIIYPLLNSRLE